MDQPDTFYARTPDGVYLAYQVVGEGPIDFVWQPDWPGSIDMEWEFASTRAGITGLAEFGRVIIHDHRGVGLSSRNVPIPNLETRTTGECEVLDGRIEGLSVSTAARVAASAWPSQVLVSQTVKDLVAGSRLELQDAGEHELKGIPGTWHLYQAIDTQSGP